MANALHATLSPRLRWRLMELRHDPALIPRERDRVEALLLSVDGMQVPRQARHVPTPGRAQLFLIAALQQG